MLDAPQDKLLIADVIYLKPVPKIPVPELPVPRMLVPFLLVCIFDGPAVSDTTGKLAVESLAIKSA